MKRESGSNQIMAQPLAKLLNFLLATLFLHNPFHKRRRRRRRKKKKTFLSFSHSLFRKVPDSDGWRKTIALVSTLFGYRSRELKMRNVFADSAHTPRVAEVSNQAFDFRSLREFSLSLPCFIYSTQKRVGSTENVAGQIQNIRRRRAD